MFTRRFSREPGAAEPSRDWSRPRGPRTAAGRCAATGRPEGLRPQPAPINGPSWQQGAAARFLPPTPRFGLRSREAAQGSPEGEREEMGALAERWSPYGAVL